MSGGILEIRSDDENSKRLSGLTVFQGRLELDTIE